MSPDRQRLRSYPDRGGPVHQTEERESDAQSIHLSCRPRLAAAGPAGVALGRAEVTFKAEAVPIQGFPHTGNIFGAGAAVKAESHRGHRIRRVPAAADRRQLLPAEGHRSCTRPASRRAAGDARTDRCEPGVPEGSARRPVGHVLGVGRVRQRTRARGSDAGVVLRAGRRPRVLHRRPLAGVAGNPLQGPLHELGGGGFGPELITEVPLVETVPGAP